MKIYSISSTNSNSNFVNRKLKPEMQATSMRKTSINTLPQYYTYLPQRHNINFNGHNLKRLDSRACKKLAGKVVEQARSYGIFLDNKPDVFRSDLTLQLMNYLLNHKIIENISVRQDLENLPRDIIRRCDTYYDNCDDGNKEETSKLRDNYLGMLFKAKTKDDIKDLMNTVKADYLERCKNAPKSGNNHHEWGSTYDDNLLKQNVVAIMDYADFISEHSIYSHENVKFWLGAALDLVTPDRLKTMICMANYLEKHQNILEDQNMLYPYLIGDIGFLKFFGLYNFNPDDYYECDSNSKSCNAAQKTSTDVPKSQEDIEITRPEQSEKESIGQKEGELKGFARVGGQNKAIELMEQKVLYPMRFPKVYEGRNIDKGIIMYGRPGTGKSLIAKALSEECGCYFKKIGATDMENMYVGQTEKQWQILFDDLIRNQPAILFIDEADALCKERGSKDVYGDKELNKVLQLMSDVKLENEQVFVILATNKFEVLDSAITRDGRFGTHIEILPPQTVDDVEQIFNIHTKNLKLDISENDRKKIFTEMLNLEYTGSAIEGVVGQAHDLAIKRTGILKKMENNTITDSDIENLHIIAEDIKTAIENREMKNRGKSIGFKKYE